MAGVGTAQITIAFDAWKEGRVAPTTHDVAVVAPKTALKLETVSDRLKGELIHPNKTSSLVGLRFSPDGRRLIGGDYPGGVVVLWDTATGQRLSTIETGYGYRGSADYIFLSPDWRTLFVAQEKRKYEQVEQDGKRMIRWEFDGNVRAWDLASGQLQRTYQHQPARNNRHLEMAPDGATFITFEELPGLSEGTPKRALTLWDVQSGQRRPLPDNLDGYAKYFPDGRTIAIAALDAENHAIALKLLDSGTGSERLSIPVTDKYASVYITAITPDGRFIVGDVRAFEQPKKFETLRGSLRWWDATTGREVASTAGEKNESWFGTRFSPDGQTLASANWGGETRKLLLFRTSVPRTAKTVLLGQQGDKERLIAREPVFSPDSRWVAVMTQSDPDVRSKVDARDVPQPRIHLVEVASGEVRETIIAPQGIAISTCFSPDGKTLATGGHGRVLLWDLAKPPG